MNGLMKKLSLMGIAAATGLLLTSCRNGDNDVNRMDRSPTTPPAATTTTTPPPSGADTNASLPGNPNASSDMNASEPSATTETPATDEGIGGSGKKKKKADAGTEEMGATDTGAAADMDAGMDAGTKHHHKKKAK